MLGRIKRLFIKPKSQIEYLRENGCKIGRNVDLVNSKIDACHPFLITIGDNVTITNSTALVPAFIKGQGLFLFYQKPQSLLT